MVSQKPTPILILMLFQIVFANTMLAQINTALPVGAIPGAIDVSPMGAATYTIPIEVVPGTQGIQPNLSIVCNSMSGMGLLGMKWNLAGISSITRYGQTPYFDNGSTTEIQFSNNDRFSLDGERLISTNGIYATEVENFTQIYPTYNAGTPVHFIAYTDDGKIVEYGTDSYSKHQLDPNNNTTILSWYVHQITDADGNYMIFNYLNNSGETLISNITYTGNVNNGMTYFAHLLFEYINIPDSLGKNTSFLGGFEMPQSKILKSITVYSNQVRVRKYQFNYMHEGFNAPAQRAIHLKEIVLYGETNNEQLNATTITWKSQTGNKSTDNQTFSQIENGYVLTGDFNGDGYTDYVHYGLGGQKNKWKLYTFNPVNGSFEDSQLGGTHLSLNAAENNCLFHKADINGDGCDELIIGNSPNVEIKYFIFSILSLKGSVTQIDTATINGFDQLYFGDFEGAGRTSILFRKKDFTYVSGDKYTFHLYTYSTGFVSTNLPAMINSNKVRLGDFNGNGKTDVELIFYNNDLQTYYYSNGNFYTYTTILNPVPTPTYLYDRYSGDFNGDGITDMLTYEMNAGALVWKVYYGKGNRKYTDTTILKGLDLAAVVENGYTVPRYKIMIADMDGDGKDDIVQLQGNTAKILYSKGCIKNIYYQHKHKYTIANASIGSGYPPPIKVNVSDFNNDGILDFVVQDNRESKPKIVYQHKGNQYDCVDSITDGMGKTTKFVFIPKYKIAKNGSVTKKYFFQTIDNLKIPDGLNGYNSFNYKFDEPAFSPLRKSFLGYEKFVCINNTDNKTDSLFFALDVNKHILKPLAQKTFINQFGVQETSYDIMFINFSNKRYVPYSNETKVLNLLTDTKTITKTTLQTDGRLQIKNTKTYNSCNALSNNWLHSETKTYFYNTIILNGNQTKTVPALVFTTQQYGSTGSGFTETLNYSYYSASEKGRLKSVQQGNTDGEITTYYEYLNTTGVCSQKMVYAVGCNPRTETYEYDNTHRFVTKITNPLLHESIFTYDSKTGNKLTEKDANNLTTAYNYDSFGKLSKITFPDGTTTKDTAFWFTGATPANARYCIKTTSSGKSDLIVYYDILGREVCRSDDGYYYDTRYDAKGQKVKTSYPYSKLTDTDLSKTWNLFTYDKHGRDSTTIAPYTNLTYSYNNRKVTITDHLRNNQTSWKDYDALGRITQAQDPGGAITYSYSIITTSGKLRHQTLITANGSITTIESDLWGNRLKIKEPNAGLITSSYNKLNELVYQQDAGNNTTTYEYDVLGRVIKKQYDIADNLAIIKRPTDTTRATSQAITIQYIYDIFSPANKGVGKLSKIKIDSVESEVFTYDLLSRLAEHQLFIDSSSFVFNYTYTSNGQLNTLTYPGGFGVKYNYYPNGKIKDIKNTSGNQLIYKVNKHNKYNQPVKCEFGNDIATEYSYNDFGRIVQINTGTVGITALEDEPVEEPSEDPRFIYADAPDSSILNYRYVYDIKGLMSSRTESVFNRKETFNYDNLDRLTQASEGQIGQVGVAQTFSYSNNGNITGNSQVGTYSYLSIKPHAVTQIEPINENIISENQSNVVHNLFNQPKQIKETSPSLTYVLDLFYDANQQCNHAIINRNGVKKNTRYYMDKYCEFETDSLNDSRYFHYIYGDNGIVALHIATVANDLPPEEDPGGEIDTVRSGMATDSMYYIHTDHLGSYCVITNAVKKVRQRNFFDSWGNNITTTPNFTIVPRGFTGHEHYPELKIINMGGRLYDPVIARFFSPDNYVQIPEFTQSFNRYSYCLNNPLSYVDPTGNTWYDVRGDRRYIDDGIDDLLINVSQRQFNRLERRFNRDFDSYENLRERMTVKNGYYTFSTFNWGGQNEGGYTLPGLRMTYFEPGGFSYSERNYRDAVMAANPGVGSNILFGERGLVDANWVIDIAVGGVTGLVKGLSRAAVKDGAGVVARHGVPTQMHHFATNKHKWFTPQMEEVASKFGLDLSGAWNKAALPHLGRHPNVYHEFVLKNMRSAADAAGKSQSTFLQLYNKNVIQPVLDNPLMLRKIGW